ncbi:MAG: hypothetical protein R8J85_06305 [Mariprofundales bacterium]
MINNNFLKKITIANNFKHFEIKGWMAGSQNKHYDRSGSVGQAGCYRRAARLAA